MPIVYKVTSQTCVPFGYRYVNYCLSIRTRTFKETNKRIIPQLKIHVNPSYGAKTKDLNRLRQTGIWKENDIINITLLQDSKENLTIKSIVDGLNNTIGSAIKKIA